MFTNSAVWVHCCSCTLPGKEKDCAALKRVKGAVLAFHEASRLFGSPIVPSGWGNLTRYNPPLSYPFYVHCAVWAFHQAGWSGRGSPFFSHFFPTTTVRAKPSEKSEKSLKSDFSFLLAVNFSLSTWPTAYHKSWLQELQFYSAMSVAKTLGQGGRGLIAGFRRAQQ